MVQLYNADSSEALLQFVNRRFSELRTFGSVMPYTWHHQFRQNYSLVSCNNFTADPFKLRQAFRELFESFKEGYKLVVNFIHVVKHRDGYSVEEAPPLFDAVWINDRGDMGGFVNRLISRFRPGKQNNYKSFSANIRNPNFHNLPGSVLVASMRLTLINVGKFGDIFLTKDKELEDVWRPEEDETTLYSNESGISSVAFTDMLESEDADF